MAAKSTILYLRIGEGKNLPRKDISGKSDPYCIVKVDNNIVARTATVWRDLEPFWGEEYTMFLPVGFTNLSVYVYDEDTIGVDDLIGRVTLDRDMLTQNPSAKGLDKWFPLSPVYHSHADYSDIQGDIKIETTLYEKGDVKKIRVKVLEVMDLPDKVRSGVVPLVKLSFGESGACYLRQTLRETVIKVPEGYKKSWIPSKQKYLEFDMKEPFQDVTLTAEVKIESETLWCSGQATFFLPMLKPGQSRDGWYKLLPLPHIKEEKTTENLGSIRMKVRLTQERILPQKCYQPLIEILVNSAKDPEGPNPTALSVIEELTAADQATLAHQMVRLFIGQDLVIPFLDYITLREIKKTSNPRTLFRGNSLAAKCMEQFMKIVGIPYLSDTLKPVIDKIFEERKYCELDPSKTERKSSAFRRLSLRPVDEQDRSLSVLTGYLEAVMTSILSSFNECPSYMRAAFRNLARRVSDHFGDEPGYEDSKYTAVSGFLFLRFYAPAILGPKLFGLRENHADKNVSRTLTILAKTVQKIGNIEFPQHCGKEEWMGPLYKWIAFYTDEVKDFLDRLADVEDEEVPGCDHRRTVFSQSLIIKEGAVKKCRYRDSRLPKPYKFKKSYCWLSTENFLYAKTNDSQTRQFLPTRKILAIERVDESAFQKPNVFQVVSKDYEDTVQILYLAAQDVNEMNQWLSAIRKTTISNPKMLSYFHPGVFNKNKWTCCKRALRQASGCQLTHTHVTLSDWRDPLDPDSEAQMIFTQLLQSREELKQKFLETKEFQKDSLDHNQNSLETVKDQQFPTKPDQTSWSASERAVAAKLVEVIDDLEKAHQTHEENAIKKS